MLIKNVFNYAYITSEPYCTQFSNLIGISITNHIHYFCQQTTITNF